jgi:integrase
MTDADLVLVDAADANSALSIHDKQLRARFVEYLAARRSKNTFAAYAQDWKAFESWLSEHSRAVVEVTPGDVAAFLTNLELQTARGGKPRRASSIERAWFGVKYVLRAMHPWAREKHPPEVIATALDSIARIRMETPTKKRALSASELARIVEPCGDDLRGLRDRALLLLGWYAMLRRSEISALEVQDLVFVPEGLRLKLRFSKTDQTGKGFEKPIYFNESARYCAVSTTRAWIERAGIGDELRGSVFRAIPARGSVVGGRGLSGMAIWAIVKARCAAVGLDAALYGAHSMRAGGITAAAEAGKPVHSIQQMSGHRSMDTLMGYVRPARLFDNEATKGIGPK